MILMFQLKERYSGKMLFNYVFRILQLCYKSYHRLDYISLQLVCMELHTYGLHHHYYYIIMYIKDDDKYMGYLIKESPNMS